MEMKFPPPRRSRFNPAVSEPQRDYNMIAPLTMDGSNYACKKYAKGSVVATFTAGSVIPVEISGSVFHMGGHCQFSISYDDSTFVVVKTVMKNCFTGTGTSFSVTIPPSTPACERCTFAWSWVNAIGNREFYMNCADIRIRNTATITTLVGKKMTVANLPGFPQIPEFPPSTYDGSDIYSKAPTVTARGLGSGSSATPTSTTITRTSTSTTFTNCATRTVTVYRYRTGTTPSIATPTAAAVNVSPPYCATRTIYKLRPAPTPT